MNDNLTPPPERDFPETQLQLRKEQLLSTIDANQGRRGCRALPTAGQCAIRSAAGSRASSPRVTPPNTRSRIRLWP